MDGAASRGRLTPTYTPARTADYRRPGGPWDRGRLDDGFSGRAAVVDRHGALGPDALDDLVDRLAGRLRAVGVRRGRAVCWQLPNGAGALALYRACWRLGAVAAPLHHRLGPAEVAAAAAQVDPALVLAEETMPAAHLPGARTLGASSGIDALAALLPDGDRVARRASAARPSDVAVALFTSGSTGVPKAALHTHRGLGYKAALMTAVHGLGPGDAVLMPAPLAHVSGLLNGVLIPAHAGIPSVLMDHWDADEGLARIEEHRVSYMGAPPVFFSQMAASSRFAPARVTSLRLISTGGASVSPAFVESTAAAFGCRVKRTYGSTEAPTVTTSGPDDPPGRARDTDGRCVGEAELSVRDPDTGRRLAPGMGGELWIRGPELFVGYADPAATARVMARGGWYRSGDLGTLDEDGWLVVTGRLSDIIIRAGENISASEVEAVLEAHPDVRHAVAVGVPDE
ncbi:MAG TPA: AMP-binding protein, partial [Acidimicrobiales bacterium]|nr:AMP-binding protein [Acidimicrobiales bacterium]